MTAISLRPVQSVDLLDVEDSPAELVAAQRPLAIRGGARDWPAVRNWTLEHLRATVGDRRVRAFVATTNWKPNEFFAQKGEDPQQHAGGYMTSIQLPLADLVSAILGDFGELPPGVYALPGCPIRQIADELLADLGSCAQCDSIDSAIPYLWLGPGGKLVPCHHDRSDGVLIQVLGTKRLVLAPPSATEALLPIEQNPYVSMIADLEAADLEQLPRLAEVPFEVCDLEPGDQLYIPQGWWHQVRYFDACISVNYWPSDYLSRGAPAESR